MVSLISADVRHGVAVGLREAFPHRLAGAGVVRRARLIIQSSSMNCSRISGPRRREAARGRAAVG